MSVGHYENFPVGSLLMPARWRRAVHVVYRFARSADDLADEGDALPTARLAALAAYHSELVRIGTHETPHIPLFIELAQVIAQYSLSLDLFHDLLRAFEQDVVQTRYADAAQVLAYCRGSANPVGRILLGIFGMQDEQSLAQSDAICSALQLINFLQDVAIDYAKGRIYLPQDQLARFGVDEAQIARADSGGTWAALMDAEIARARALLDAGAPLGRTLRGRVGVELRLIIAGGDTILHKLERVRGDVFRQRPRLCRWDWVKMLSRALCA